MRKAGKGISLSRSFAHCFPASVPKVEWKENLQPTERFCHFIEQTILLDDFSFV